MTRPRAAGDGPFENGRHFQEDELAPSATGNSRPTGTPSGTVGTEGENPVGITTPGKPVIAPRMPLRSIYDSPIGTTTSLFCWGYAEEKKIKPRSFDEFRDEQLRYEEACLYWPGFWRFPLGDDLCSAQEGKIHHGSCGF